MASGKSDEVKGRVKEAAGVLTGDKKLERQGKTDQAVGKLKQTVEKVKKKAEEAIDAAQAALRCVRVNALCAALRWTQRSPEEQSLKFMLGFALP